MVQHQKKYESKKMANNIFIPVNTPLISGNEKKYLLEAIDSGWISSEGPFVKQFEEKFAQKVKRKYAVAVANGSAALEIAVSALGISEGHEVILPTFTIISCVAPLIRVKALPVVVDSDPLTWNMDVKQIEKKITNKTKAIMVVHIYGLPVDMDPVRDLASKYGLKLIEDAAEAHGLTYKGKNCGSFGDISTFSFYSNKLVTTGEGGMVVTDDPDVAEQCRFYRNLCFQSERRFVHDKLGWNYRMTNLQAAVGLAQLERLEEFVEIKKRIGKKYFELLKEVDGIQLPVQQTEYAENIYWVYGLVIKDDVNCINYEMMSELKKYRIGTRPFFWPIHEQPVFKKMGMFEHITCPVSERIARKGFYLPSGLGIGDFEIETVAKAVTAVLEKVCA